MKDTDAAAEVFAASPHPYARNGGNEPPQRRKNMDVDLSRAFDSAQKRQTSNLFVFDGARPIITTLANNMQVSRDEEWHGSRFDIVLKKRLVVFRTCYNAP